MAFSHHLGAASQASGPCYNEIALTGTNKRLCRTRKTNGFILLYLFHRTFTFVMVMQPEVSRLL